jgi:hypothetical protein
LSDFVFFSEPVFFSEFVHVPGLSGRIAVHVLGLSGRPWLHVPGFSGRA